MIRQQVLLTKLVEELDINPKTVSGPQIPRNTNPSYMCTLYMTSKYSIKRKVFHIFIITQVIDISFCMDNTLISCGDQERVYSYIYYYPGH
jgi:hypothetical protein